ncbi:probable peptidyl-alpha-hydroxyglycine alpha-amidating lyase pgal-1 [Biomphalaria glabrata]|uniref:peptidylamidoglycolate lyase n=1 Tax=Biomphalaria glabrata TaxID=6526 RepID=A0A9W3AHD9_BIOGL|nr:probable peptidyl-alpha-hydroxyglycine alpha-amidating lyase pgal-1 [Biomphalaria glabrata]
MYLWLLCAVALVTTSKAYPLLYDDWTAQDLKDYFLQRANDQSRPVLDPNFNIGGDELGQVSAVDVDSDGHVYVFHRADRPWTMSTYKANSDILTDEAKTPIGKDTILKVDPKSGQKIESFGKDIFNVPHGLTIDHKDNIWVTDVGRHQVLRIPKGATKPDLELGEKFVSGDDDKHFCKPTDVAVASNGDFFVADGYCNNRVLKFSSTGKLLSQWGAQEGNNGMTPYTLNIPHSLTLIEELDLICVADRENSRALCYNAGLHSAQTPSQAQFNRTLIPQSEIGRVFAIAYNKAAQEVVAAGVVSEAPIIENDSILYPPRAFTYDLEGRLVTSWAFITQEMAELGPSLIHDLCVSKNGQDFYLADLDQQRVYKYTTNWEAVLGGA